VITAPAHFPNGGRRGSIAGFSAGRSIQAIALSSL
jgi:hypothetical protein